MPTRHLPEHLAELASELPLMLTKDEALIVLRMSPRTFERLVARGELPVTKTSAGQSSTVTVTRAAILRWLMDREAT